MCRQSKARLHMHCCSAGPPGGVDPACNAGDVRQPAVPTQEVARKQGGSPPAAPRAAHPWLLCAGSGARPAARLPAASAAPSAPAPSPPQCPAHQHAQRSSMHGMGLLALPMQKAWIRRKILGLSNSKLLLFSANLICTNRLMIRTWHNTDATREM